MYKLEGESEQRIEFAKLGLAIVAFQTLKKNLLQVGIDTPIWIVAIGTINQIINPTRGKSDGINSRFQRGSLKP
jgi:hypothetical protein